MMTPVEDRHAYDAQCPCPACRAEGQRRWMREDDGWLHDWGEWQASPWNVGDAAGRLREYAQLGTNAYIGKRYRSKPPVPVSNLDIGLAVSTLDARSAAAIEVYYVLGVGFAPPKNYPDLYPDEIEREERQRLWLGGDSWGDAGVADAFRRAVDQRRMAADEGGFAWVLTGQRWGQIRHAAIAVIVRRVAGG